MARRGRRGAWLALLFAWGCGHSIGPGLDFEPGPRFDFRQPPSCAPSGHGGAAWPVPDAPGDVVIRYLGAGGIYVGWQGHAVMTAPFVTNPGRLRALAGWAREDEALVAASLGGLQLETVGAIFAGHSHYDHVGDLPAVARLAENAKLHVNRSGRTALVGSYPQLESRIELLDAQSAGNPIEVADANGVPLPFRVLPLLSTHAPHVFSLTLWMGETREGARKWGERGYGGLRAGQPFAFVIDLLDGRGPSAPVAFRLYVQDSANQAPDGVPGSPVEGDPPYDLAVLCMASTQWVKGHPQALLDAIAPRHALVTHYEDFTRPWGWRRGFVPLLTRGVANRFLRRTAAALEAGGQAPAPPIGARCGPGTELWTMPLTGEWLVFRPRPR